MATLDLIVDRSQSNTFLTKPDPRGGPADVIRQPDVPCFSALAYAPTNARVKLAPRLREGLDTRYWLYSEDGTRVYCPIPAYCVYRLTKVYGHKVRLFVFAVGASTYVSDWPVIYAPRSNHYLARALASPAYAALPPPDKRFLITIHGEQDANASFASFYQGQMTALIPPVRTTLGDLTAHVVVCQLNSLCFGGNADVNTVRAAEAAWVAGDAHASLYDLSAFALSSDNIHYDSAGALGNGYGLADHIHART